MKAKRNTQKRLDNLRLEVELDNINQNTNMTMAPIKQQMIKPSDTKYLVSGPDIPQLGFNPDVLDVGQDENLIENIEDAVGYQDPEENSISDEDVEVLARADTESIRPNKFLVLRLAQKHP